MSGGIDRELSRFESVVLDTRRWLGATEILWLTAPAGSTTRQQLGPLQLEALHEAAFLRVFGAWESYLEECAVRFMAGQTTASYPRVVPVESTTLDKTIAAARLRLLNGRRFLLWHNPGTVVTRLQRYLVGCPVEDVLTTHQPRIDLLAAIRHRIAHTSDDARTEFISAATTIAGVNFDGVAGRMLRAANVGDGLTQRMWTYEFTEELRGYAIAIAA